MLSGELVSRITTDVGRVLDALVAVTTTLVPDLLLVASIFAVLATLDVELALVGLSVVPALTWFAGGRRRPVALAPGVDRSVLLEPVSDHHPQPRHRRISPGPAVATPLPGLISPGGG